MDENMATSMCPDDATLRAFESGTLVDGDWEQWADHIAICGHCQNRLDAEGSKNHFAALLRDSVRRTPQSDRGVERTLEAVAVKHDEIAGYRLLECIGRGGMGEVYKAEHSHMKRIVAVKLLPISANLSRTSVSRFQREVEAAAKLVHRNVVTAFDAGEHHGRPFLVMEYVEGESLATIVRRYGTLPVSEAVEFVRQAAVALEYAHARESSIEISNRVTSSSTKTGS